MGKVCEWSEVARWERWENSEVARSERWERNEVAIWERRGGVNREDGMEFKGKTVVLLQRSEIQAGISQKLYNVLDVEVNKVTVA